MKRGNGIAVIFFCIAFVSAQTRDYDPTKPRKMCNDMQGDAHVKTWGPHNVLPNLYEHVYRPFLDAFTYTATCKDDMLTPVLCDKILRIGSLSDRCTHIGANSMWVQYAIIVHYLTEGWWNAYSIYPLQHEQASDETLLLLDSCGGVMRKGDSAYHPYKECLRSTTAYQCVWNNALWLAIPIVLVLLCILIFLGISIFSACMLAIE